MSVIKKSNLSKSMHICSLFDGVRLNDFNEFLIVLSDYHYYDWLCIFPFFQRELDIIKSNKYFFPGKLHIKYESEVRDDISGNFNIKGIVQLKTLYIKLPKENIYVDSSKFQEELFESKFNELLNIFASLNARYVDFYFHNMDKYIENLSTSMSLSKVEAGESILSNHKTQSKRRIRAEYSDKSYTPFDTDKFKEKRVFYYLPKEHGWRNVIKNRLENKMLTQEYTYKYSESSFFSADFYNCLKRLNIKFHYASEKYNEVKIEYFIEYWPNKPVEPEHLRFSQCMLEATAETNMEDFERRMEIILEKKERARAEREQKRKEKEDQAEYEESPFLLLRLFSYLNPVNMFHTDNMDNDNSDI
jgi:hypothetical protein